MRVEVVAEQQRGVPVRRVRRAAGGRSGGGSPRRSSRARARSRSGSRAARNRLALAARRVGRSASAPERRSRVPPRPAGDRLRRDHASRRTLGERPRRSASISSSPWASETNRPRTATAQRRSRVEQVAEERAVAVGVARCASSKLRDGRRRSRTASASRRRAGRVPNGASPPRAGRRAARAPRRRPGRAGAGAPTSPAAVASGFPESVPAW